MFGVHEASALQEKRLIVDDSTLTCVFPCEENESPSQGHSFSLCSSDSSSIGLQSFEPRHTGINNPQNQQEEIRLMDSSSRDGGFFGKSPASISHHQKQILHHHGQFQLRSCKYLGAGQELLNEFCSLGTKQMDAPKPRRHKSKQWEGESESESESGTGSSSMKQSLCSLEFTELQKRESRLLSMLDEVKGRYEYYRVQMKALVSSFEAVAGDGSASVYSALASKTISRHFRCLKDGIVAQIHATKKAMEEKDPVARGTSEGETPQLRITDKARRRQRAFQRMSMMESHPWRPQRGLPERSFSVLRAWLFEHFLHPYPSEADKHILARNTGLSRSQVSNWFINARVRLWKPMVEEMYMEETKDLIINRASSDGDFDDSIGWPNQNPCSADQKPTPDQLAQIDSECLSSIMSDPDKNDSDKVSSKAFQSHPLHLDHRGFGAFGAEELDFSSYNHHPLGGFSYAKHDQCGASNRNFNGSGGGVSLTLGLQQNRVSGVSLAFSPASQSSLFSARDHIEDCQLVQHSLLDGEGQNLPYRNLTDHEIVEDLGEIDSMQEREVSGKDDNWDPRENVQAYMSKAEAHHSSEEELIRSPGLNDCMSNKWDFELTDPIRGSTGKLLMQLVEKAIDLFWDACPSRSLSLNFRAEILSVLNLTRYNDARLWMGQQDLVSLKQVDLSYSSLIMLPDLSKASNLWSLNLQGCINLVEVSTIQFLINLEYLNLNGCTSLRSLPSMMALKLLCSLHLSGCSKIRRLPLSIGCLSGLIVLDIGNCKRLKNLPISTSRLKSIQNLNISGCSKLMKHLSGSGMEKATQSVMGSSLFLSESIINPGSYISSNSSSDDISVRPQNNEILCPSRTPEEGKSFEVKVLEDPLSVTAASPLGRTEGIEEFLLAESSESLNQLVVQHCQKRCLESLMQGSSNTANFEGMPSVRRRISSESEPPSSSTTKEKESTELEGGIKPSSVFLEPSLARNETRSKGLVQTSPSEDLQSEDQENSAKEMVLPRPLGIESSNECAAYLNYGFSQQRKALESYMAMPVEAIHEADAYEDIGRILDVMIQQTSDLHKRTILEDIMSFLEELNENIPDTVTCLKSSRTDRTLLQLKLTCLDISLVKGQEQYTSLEAKLATISKEEAKLEAEIQLLMAKKEELSKEHQTTPN